MMATIEKIKNFKKEDIKKKIHKFKFDKNINDLLFDYFKNRINNNIPNQIFEKIELLNSFKEMSAFFSENERNPNKNELFIIFHRVILTTAAKFYEGGNNVSSSIHQWISRMDSFCSKYDKETYEIYNPISLSEIIQNYCRFPDTFNDLRQYEFDENEANPEHLSTDSSDENEIENKEDTVDEVEEEDQEEEDQEEEDQEEEDDDE